MKSTEAVAESDLADKILDIVAAEAMIDRQTVTLSTPLDELNIQSADYVMILMAIEEQFGIYMSVDSELTDAKTAGDLLQIVVAKIEAASGEAAV